MTKRDWKWLAGVVFGPIITGIVTFYATREGLIQELREQGERLVRIEVIVQQTALHASGRDQLGPVPEEEE